MKERPILFNAEMVRAVLDGRKTQTRRVVKPQPVMVDGSGPWQGRNPHSKKLKKKKQNLMVCPYGLVGDRLWVRESMRYSKEHDNLYFIADSQGVGVARYCGLQGKFPRKYIPSIHMPRWASRITLEITGVRVERVQGISEEDAKAEGTEPSIVGSNFQGIQYRAGFQTLWKSINAKRGYGWEVSPWVWVIEFKRINP